MVFKYIYLAISALTELVVKDIEKAIIKKSGESVEENARFTHSSYVDSIPGLVCVEKDNKQMWKEAAPFESKTPGKLILLQDIISVKKLIDTLVSADGIPLKVIHERLTGELLDIAFSRFIPQYRSTILSFDDHAPRISGYWMTALMMSYDYPDRSILHETVNGKTNKKIYLPPPTHHRWYELEPYEMRPSKHFVCRCRMYFQDSWSKTAHGASVWLNEESGRNIAVVNYRGSSTMSDFFQDGKSVLGSAVSFYDSYGKILGQAASGFSSVFYALNAFVSPVLDRMMQEENIQTIYFSGHSLGGAVAQLATMFYASKYKNLLLQCLTIGSPPCVKPDLHLAAKLVNVNWYCVTNQTDLVTNWASKLRQPWYHVSPILYEIQREPFDLAKPFNNHECIHYLRTILLNSTRIPEEEQYIETIAHDIVNKG